MESTSGFRELEHTADWALEVWGPDLPTLFQRAAEGMYSLMETALAPAPRVQRELQLEGADLESLLVGFLTELLYLSESEGLAFDTFQVNLDAMLLRATIQGAPLSEQRKEIKAVTYHNLRVHPTEAGVQVVIVFDV